MSTQRRLLPVVAITGSSIMVGCGGYSGSSCGFGSYGSYGSFGSFGAAAAKRTRVGRAKRAGSKTSATGYAAVCPGGFGVGADGIYEGTLSTGTSQPENPVFAIIDVNGDGRISAQDGTYYRLTLSAVSTSVSGTFTGFSQGVSFPNGSLTTSGSLSAMLTPPGIDGTLTDQGGNSQMLALNFDNAYGLGSSLATLAGTWNYSANGFSLTATIQTDGTFTALDASGCSYSGSFGLIDPNFNAYSESYTRSCNGTILQFTGLASYFPAAGTSAAQIMLLADDDAGQYLVAILK